HYEFRREIQKPIHFYRPAHEPVGVCAIEFLEKVLDRNVAGQVICELLELGFAFALALVKKAAGRPVQIVETDAVDQPEVLGAETKFLLELVPLSIPVSLPEFRIPDIGCDESLDLGEWHELSFRI